MTRHPVETPDQLPVFLAHLSELCREIAKGRRGDPDRLFELTKSGPYPEEVRELAESFGMMLVKVEAREFHLRKTIDQLNAVKREIESARDRLDRENAALRRNLGTRFSSRSIIGKNPRMIQILRQVEQIADTPVNVLITGETGTGKDLIAKTLHYGSLRNKKPFITINCSAIPESLLESELFGIEKGVATGVEKRIGKIEQADGGTLFLDEIGDMPLSSQTRLLRVLQERELIRVGGKKPIQVGIRVAAATNRDLRRAVEKRRFREDLYFRLKVVRFTLPPLRERPEDIPLLADFFLKTSARRMGRNAMRFSDEAVDCLRGYAWPGNVRELENEVERAVVLTISDMIEVGDLSEEIRRGRCDTPDYGAGATLRKMEKRLIVKTLAATDGNKTAAARQLGISREGLRKKMKRYDL